MQNIVLIIHNVYKKMILKLSGELVLSLFISLYLFYPIYNIIRSLFLIPFNTDILVFFVGLILLLFIVFKIQKLVYYKTLSLLFNDFFVKYKKIICFGAFILYHYPLIFGIYICLSISSFHLIRECPDDLLFHIYYILCICFRNIFILPALGYVFIINISKKQSEIFAIKQDSVFYNKLLFINTQLIHDTNFFRNLDIWSKWLSEIKPSQNIIKSTSYVSLLTTISWYMLFFFRWVGNRLKEVFEKNKSILEQNISNFVNLKIDTETEINFNMFLQKIAININTKNSDILSQLSKYSDNSFLLGVNYFFKKSTFNELKDESLALTLDSIKLNYCYDLGLENKTSQKVLEYLIKKYTPQNYFNFEKMIKNSHTNNSVLHNKQSNSEFFNTMGDSEKMIIIKDNTPQIPTSIESTCNFFSLCKKLIFSIF